MNWRFSLKYFCMEIEITLLFISVIIVSKKTWCWLPQQSRTKCTQDMPQKIMSQCEKPSHYPNPCLTFFPLLFVAFFPVTAPKLNFYNRQDQLKPLVMVKLDSPDIYILLTKTTAAQNEAALSCHRLRGLYFLAVVSVRSIIHSFTNWKKLFFGIIKLKKR